MRGHASSELVGVVERLEALSAAGTISLQELVLLGQLYVEPCHEEDKAVAIFEKVLEGQPDHELAGIWLAYCALHHLMDEESLRRAELLILAISSSSSSTARSRAAAYQLLASLRGELEELSLPQEIALYEESIALEQSWVYNRYFLAEAFDKAERKEDARSMMSSAIANARKAEARDFGVFDEPFETCITGRTGASMSFLEGRLRKFLA